MKVLHHEGTIHFKSVLDVVIKIFPNSLINRLWNMLDIKISTLYNLTLNSFGHVDEDIIGDGRFKVG
jgi:hypothetical protein